MYERRLSPTKKRKKLLTFSIEAVEEATGRYVLSWPGNCYAIVTAMVERDLVDGEAVYGHYFGPIHGDSLFAGRPFTHHGWVETATQIIDPTRWVFESTEPYIYEGPKPDEDYDRGSNRLRAMTRKPPPLFHSHQSCFLLPPQLAIWALTLLGRPSQQVCAEQIGWLASLPLDVLKPFELILFNWIVDDIKLPGLIPYDNRKDVLGK